METTATKKGQIVIPVELRRKYGIEAGTKIHVSDEDGKIVLEPITSDYISKLRGIAKGSGTLESLLEERRKDKEKENEAFDS